MGMSVGNPNRGLDAGRGFADGDPNADAPAMDPADALQRDAAFVALLRAGDPSAFGLLVDGWADPVFDRIRHHGYGFSAAEIAAVLNEPVDTIDDIMRKLPMGFGAVVRAQVLWRQGAPTHDVLAAAVAEAKPFDTTTVRLIANHQRDCPTCRE